MSDSREDDVADRLVLSYRSVEGDDEDGDWSLANGDWIRERMAEPSYLGYLRTVHGGEVTVGEEWEEFVNCGCASPEDVVIRVEDVVGGSVFGEGTDVEITPREDVLTP